MDKFIKTIFIISLIVLVPGFVLASDEKPIITPNPIFNSQNLVPGSFLESEVEIKNNSDNDYEVIKIRGERKTTKGEVDLAEVMEIKMGNNEKINLADFLDGEGIFLTEEGIQRETSKSFDFSVFFKEEAGNKYQGIDLYFDFIFVFLKEGENTEEEEEEEETVRVGGVVDNEEGEEEPLEITAVTIEEEVTTHDSVVINWNTNNPAFGRVIYDTESDQFDFNAGEPSYGYSFFTPKTEKKTTSHSITLTNLNPGKTYHYRTVSYASLAISEEHQFTLLEEPEPAPEPVPDSAPVLEPELEPELELESDSEPASEFDPEYEPEFEEEEISSPEPTLEEEEEESLFAATIGAFGIKGDTVFYSLLFILILLILGILIRFALKMKK